MDNIELFKRKNDRATLTDTTVSSDSIFFENKKPEMRKILRKKLKVIKQEKNSLEEAITTKNNEIEELKKSVHSLKEVINSVPIEELKNNSQIAGRKIVELNKKNRILRTDLDSSRNKNAILEAKLHKLEMELKKVVEKRVETENQKMAKVSLGELQSKLSQTKQKLFDSLNQNIELKNQLKLAQKCIQQEIGENVNLNILATSGTTWRGRAQQIITLQLKINELKDQLESTKSMSNWSEIYPNEPSIRREQINHRAEVDSLQKDLEGLTDHIEEQNQKIAALKARNLNLSSDNSKIKEKCSSMEIAVRSNNEDVATLTKKLEIQMFHYESRIREIQKNTIDIQKDRDNIAYQKEDLKIKLENLKTEIDEKEKQISELNEINKKLEKDLKLICGGFLFQCRDFRKEEFQAILDSLELEKTRLLELNKTMHERLDAERSKELNLMDQMSKYKIKISRLEGKIRDLEKELETQSEKKKRSVRISEYTNSINNNISNVPSFVFENSSLTDIPSRIDDEDEKIKKFEMTDLKNQLEIASEKIILLQDKLNYLNEEKLSDAEAFKNVIKLSKNVLLNSIQQTKIKSETLLSK